MPVLYTYLYNLSGGQLAPPNADTGLTVLNKGNVGQFLKTSRFQGGSSAQQYLPRPAGAIATRGGPRAASDTSPRQDGAGGLGRACPSRGRRLDGGIFRHHALAARNPQHGYMHGMTS